VTAEQIADLRAELAAASLGVWSTAFISLPAPGVTALLDKLDSLTIERDAAYRQGVEAMRAAAVEVARKRANLPVNFDTDAAWCRSAQCIVDELRELAVSEDGS
jgi:hypothetical protein